MEVSTAIEQGWKFPGLVRAGERNYPLLSPCPDCSRPVSHAKDPESVPLKVDFHEDGVVAVHECPRALAVIESQPAAEVRRIERGTVPRVLPATL